MSIGRRRARALEKLLRLVRRGLVSDGDGDEFVDLYARAFGARGIVVGQEFGFHPWCTSAEIPPEWPAEHTRLRAQDPSAEFLTREPAGTPFIASRRCGPEEQKRELFQFYSRREGFADVMVQRFTTPWQNDVFLAVYRRRGQRTFSVDDERLASLLFPHVAGALATRSALHAIEGETSIGALADGDARVGFPQLDVRMSRRAKDTWTRELGALSAVGWRRVERIVARAALDFHRGAPGSRSRLVHPMIRAELAWVPPEPGESHAALVLFFREAKAARPLAAPFAELLSPAQRRVAQLAASGATNPQIGKALGVSPETARTHLNEVFRRLGVSRRTELAALLSTGLTR
jgi:DNA-binding CsgD family transcriptional regulator